MEGWKARWAGILLSVCLLLAVLFSGCGREAIVGNWVPDAQNPSQLDITFNANNTASYRIHHHLSTAPAPLILQPVLTPEQEAARKQMELQEKQFEAMKWGWSNKGGIYTTWLLSADKPVYFYRIDGRYLECCDRTGRKLHGRWTKAAEKSPN